MSNEDMVSQEQFDSLRKDVKEIKGALLGNSQYGQKGYLDRLEETEERSWANKHKIDRAWYYLIGAGAVIGFIITVLQMILRG